MQKGIILQLKWKMFLFYSIFFISYAVLFSIISLISSYYKPLDFGINHAI